MRVIPSPYVLVAALAAALVLQVSCKKNDDPEPPPVEEAPFLDTTVSDTDGHVYHVLRYGSQYWLKENLRSTRFANGDPIPVMTSVASWSAANDAEQPAACYYGFDSGHAVPYGLEYNWYAVRDERNICPRGWHVPSDGEFKTLESTLGMNSFELDLTGMRGWTDTIGGHMKTVDLWIDPNVGADDRSGFSGVPSAYVTPDGISADLGHLAYFWTSTESAGSGAWERSLHYSHPGINRNVLPQNTGVCVRCLRD